MTKVFLTGGTGFIGSNLRAFLSQSAFHVEILARPQANRAADTLGGVTKVHWYTGEYESVRSALAASKPDIVIHLATHFVGRHVSRDIAPMIQSNVLFGNHLLEGMAECGLKNYIDAGTFWQHFNGDAYNPAALYAATKQAFQDILRYYVEAAGIRAITLEFFETYGPLDTRPKILNLLIQKLRENAPMHLSPGFQELDFVHVLDVCRAFRLAMDLLTESGMRRFAVSSGNPVNLRELVRLLESVAEREGQFKFGTLQYREREIFQAKTPVPRLPGWNAQISLEAGIRELWMRNFDR